MHFCSAAADNQPHHHYTRVTAAGCSMLFPLWVGWPGRDPSAIAISPGFHSDNSRNKGPTCFRAWLPGAELEQGASAPSGPKPSVKQLRDSVSRRKKNSSPPRAAVAVTITRWINADQEPAPLRRFLGDIPRASPAGNSTGRRVLSQRSCNVLDQLVWVPKINRM